jgi:penicillin-insensitive murein endopeptidase
MLRFQEMFARSVCCWSALQKGRTRVLWLAAGLLAAAVWPAGVAAETVAIPAPETPGAPVETALGDPDRWARLKTPKAGDARAIGSYVGGCVLGATSLPPDGRGYQVMRLSRGRFFGHPSLIVYLQKLARTVKRAGLGVLLIGDLSQARGGPTPTGHASHQSGLDVDIWYTYPRQALRRSMRLDERETLSAESVVDLERKQLTRQWSWRIAKVLKLAAADKRVERIFVNPVIKRELCTKIKRKSKRRWLRKLRPWRGHHDHFHVRLACPRGNADCVPQEPIEEGDGCDDLDWWFRPRPPAPASPPEAAEEAPPPTAVPVAPRKRLASLPGACVPLLD